MSKFTPGPWHVAGGTYSERWVVDSESPKVGKQNLIAMLQNHWKGNMRGDMDASAALIAAAPAMYEALKELLDVRGKTACMVLEAQEKARKVLRAADGDE